MSRRSSSLSLPSFDLEDHTKRGIAAVALFALSILFFLGLFGMAGAFGRVMDGGTAFIFGWDRIIFFGLLAAWGYHVLRPEELPIRFSNVMGMFLLFISVNPLMHAITFPGEGMVDDAALTDAGGKLGQMIGVPLIHLMGLAGMITLTIALCLVSLMLLFNASLADVLFFLKHARDGIVWLAQLIWRPIAAWRERRMLAREIPAGFAAESLLSEELLEPIPTEDPNEEEEIEEEVEEAEEESDEDEDVEEEEKIAPPPKVKKRFPKVDVPFDLLDRRDQKPTATDTKLGKELIRKTLDTFGISVEMGEIAVGPTVTQFTLKPADGVKISRIVSLQNDLALALSAQSLRIEAPIPGKPYIGIEVPNQSVAMVGAREMLESKEFRERKSGLTFVLGKDVTGKPWVADLGRMPHALVAGATGSGKSVCLNIMILSFLYANSPDELKFIMVDPKRVEFQVYNGIPHLITPVITKMTDAVNALKWAVREMDRRYDILSKVNARNISDYNARVPEKMPSIVFVIDELADLMVTAKNDIEGPIVRLCQMARAVGIHLVLATQRPSVDVITGLIKANVPARIAFAVASSMDSRTILDQVGADRLLGRGDMLLSTAEMSQPRRIQGAFVSDQEIVKVVDFVKTAYGPGDYDATVTERASTGGTVLGAGNDGGDDGDALLPHAREEVIRAGKASASLLQRRLKVIISGGTGSGKTTLLNILASFIPPGERIITVEDSAELQLSHEHWGRLETRPANIEGKGEVSIRDLVRNTLRMRPDRIVVGECRAGEALDMLQAMNTGHDGSMTTVHSNSPRDAVARLETLVMMAGMDLPAKAIREQIASAVNLIVQQSRLSDGTRKVTSITEVIGMQGDVVTLQEVFAFKRTGMDKNRKVLGKYVATGFIPKFIDELEQQGIKIPRGIFSVS
jgi:S-DNA-T family DNA segregation ATPase FtsK/SpoIIIE